MNSCDVFFSGLYHDPSPLQAFFPMAFPLRHGFDDYGWCVLLRPWRYESYYEIWILDLDSKTRKRRLRKAEETRTKKAKQSFKLEEYLQLLN